MAVNVLGFIWRVWNAMAGSFAKKLKPMQNMSNHCLMIYGSSNVFILMESVPALQVMVVIGKNMTCPGGKNCYLPVIHGDGRITMRSISAFSLL